MDRSAPLKSAEDCGLQGQTESPRQGLCWDLRHVTTSTALPRREWEAHLLTKSRRSSKGRSRNRPNHLLPSTSTNLIVAGKQIAQSRRSLSGSQHAAALSTYSTWSKPSRILRIARSRARRRSPPAGPLLATASLATKLQLTVCHVAPEVLRQRSKPARIPT